MLAYMVIWKARRLFEAFVKPEGDLRVSSRNIREKLEKVVIGKIKIGDTVKEQFAPVDREIKTLLKAAGLSADILAKRYLSAAM